MRRSFYLLLPAALLGAPAGSHLDAQAICPWYGASPVACGTTAEDASGWQSQAAVLGANVLLSGLTAGALQELRGGSFRDGFRRGALGGGVTYLGKRVAAQRWWGAGLLGRATGSAGASVVRNAGAGEPSLSEVVLPLGPARLYLQPQRGPSARLQVDPVGVVVLALAATDRELGFDAGASLSAGAPVFRARTHSDGRTWTGRQTAGVIRTRPFDGSAEERRRFADVLTHERIHVLQYDQSYLLWGAPLEQRVLSALPAGEAVGRWLDLPLELSAWWLLHRVVPYRRRPWEAEAFVLSDVR